MALGLVGSVESWAELNGISVLSKFLYTLVLVFYLLSNKEVFAFVERFQLYSSRFLRVPYQSYTLL